MLPTQTVLISGRANMAGEIADLTTVTECEKSVLSNQTLETEDGVAR